MPKINKYECCKLFVNSILCMLRKYSLNGVNTCKYALDKVCLYNFQENRHDSLCPEKHM